MLLATSYGGPSPNAFSKKYKRKAIRLCEMLRHKPQTSSLWHREKSHTQNPHIRTASLPKKSGSWKVSTPLTLYICHSPQDAETHPPPERQVPKTMPAQSNTHSKPHAYPSTSSFAVFLVKWSDFLFQCILSHLY